MNGSARKLVPTKVITCTSTTTWIWTKNALLNKLFGAVDNMLEAYNYFGAIQKLTHDIRPKMDGDGLQDWIIDQNAQQDLCMMIDAFVVYLETLV